MSHPSSADTAKAAQLSLYGAALEYLDGSDTGTMHLTEPVRRRITIQLADECLRITISGKVPENGKYLRNIFCLPNPELDSNAHPSQIVEAVEIKKVEEPMAGFHFNDIVYHSQTTEEVIEDLEVKFDPGIAEKFAALIKQAIDSKNKNIN